MAQKRESKTDQFKILFIPAAKKDGTQIKNHYK